MALTKRQFFSVLATRTGLSEKTIRKVHEQLFLLLVEELKFNGEVDIPRICKITTRVQGGRDRKCFDKGYIFVAEYLAIKFKVKEDLLNFVNGRAIGHESKKFKKRGKKRRVDIQMENLSFEDRQKNLDKIIEDVMEEKED